MLLLGKAQLIAYLRKLNHPNLCTHFLSDSMNCRCIFDSWWCYVYLQKSDVPLSRINSMIVKNHLAWMPLLRHASNLLNICPIWNALWTGKHTLIIHVFITECTPKSWRKINFGIWGQWPGRDFQTRQNCKFGRIIIIIIVPQLLFL